MNNEECFLWTLSRALSLLLITVVLFTMIAMFCWVLGVGPWNTDRIKAEQEAIPQGMRVKLQKYENIRRIIED